MWKWLKNLFKKKEEKDMSVGSEKQELMTKVINCFEQGAPEFRHDKVDYLVDGVFPGSSTRRTQITISFGLTETSLLPKFLKEYVGLGAKFSEDFKPYLSRLGKVPLARDSKLEALLKKAAREDRVYTALIETYFYEKYFVKALGWAKENGFTEYLSILVILDSFIHSGSMLDFLRKRFPENVPIKGGDEKNYIKQYLQVRVSWLKNHSDKTLRRIWTRPQFYLDLVNKNNWNLDQLPIYPNGVKVS